MVLLARRLTPHGTGSRSIVGSPVTKSFILRLNVVLGMIDGTASLISVDDDDIQRANLTSDSHWRNATVEYGEVNGGGYMATLEVFHQLHCLVIISRPDVSMRGY